MPRVASSGDCVVIVRWRRSADTDEELDVAARYCDVKYLLADVPDNSTVCARYCALPFYRDVEQELARRGSRLVNTWRQHRFVADIGEWAPKLGALTPRTWSWDDYVRSPWAGPVVLKGETNSRKFLWDTHMFAPDLAAAVQVMRRLREDSLVGDQPIWVREHVPLRTYFIGPRGLPITEEYRFFVLDGEIVTGGYYWSSYAEELGDEVSPSAVPRSFLDGVVHRVGTRCRFYAVDVARTAKGEWIVVELNDGQMAGPSECDLDELYRAIARAA